MKRIIKLIAEDGEQKVKIEAEFLSRNGLTKWEVEERVEELRNKLVDVLRNRYNFSEIR